MRKHRTPGIYWRETKNGGDWKIRKKYLGIEITGSCHTTCEVTAERILNARMEEISKAIELGIRPKIQWSVAAKRYIDEKKHLRDIDTHIAFLLNLDKYFKRYHLGQINNSTCQQWIVKRRKDGVKTRTINRELKVIRSILILAANNWFSETGLSWIEHAPNIDTLKVNDAIKREPLDWDEQDKLLQALDSPMDELALFLLNSCAREQEVASLEWDWEWQKEEDGEIVRGFEVPAYAEQEYFVRWKRDKNGELIATTKTKEFKIVKMGRTRHIILNSTNEKIVDSRRENGSRYVFPNQYGYRFIKLNNYKWKKGVKESGIDTCIHALRHTGATRLINAGVDMKTVRDILDHADRTVTDGYIGCDALRMKEALELLTIRKKSFRLSRVGKVSRLITG